MKKLIIIIAIISTFGLNISVSAKSKNNTKKYSTFQYRCVGPTRGGRVTAVEGVHSIHNIFYIGATGGGVWKTQDYGLTWNNISDGYFETPSIGDIAVSQEHPDIIYVGTGSDGLRSNVITGKGVYKSIDAGKSWKHVGLKNVGQIGAVEIFPNNPDTVFVAAIGQAFNPNKERGVYRTFDGGKSWENVLFLSDTIGAVDIEFAPDNPNTIYATMWRAERKPWTIISGGFQAGGIYKSTDLGNSWDKLTNGLPKGLIGKIDLATSPADPNRLYAIVEAPGDEGGLYVSKNKGESFELVSSNRDLVNRPFYYCNVEADPINADIVYSMAGRFLKSIDGGKNWTYLRPPHGDNHDLWINKNDNQLLIQSNDGGANVSFNGGKTWTTQFNQPTAEIYQVEVDNQYPYWIYAGQQDNSAISVPSRPDKPQLSGASGYWTAVGGCETGPSVPKPDDPNIVYSNCKGKFGVYNKLTGQEQRYYIGATNIYSHNPKDLKYRFQRVSPIYVSQHNTSNVYMGSQFLHRTTNNGVSWEQISPDLTAFEPDKQVISGTPITRDITGEEYYSTIYSIRESPLKEGLIWVGSNDGPIHVTKDGGNSWNNVTPNIIKKGGRVDCVEPSHFSEGKVYATVLRYQLGDWKPYILSSNDFGKSWKVLTNGSNGIPADYPVRVVREDPEQEGLLYAGTEFGVFISFDDGENWEAFQQNLPVTPVTDIKIHRGDLILSTMGRSFWILDDITPLRDKNINGEKVTLFKPKDTYRFRYRATSPNSIPYYPTPSATINYTLPNKVQGEIKLKIINSKNEIIREYSSKKIKNTNQENLMRRWRSSSRSTLSKNQGINKFTWDLRRGGNNSFSSRGVLALPDKYQVELSVNGKTYSQEFNLIMDPKIKSTGISINDLIEQESLALKVHSLYEKAVKLSKNVKKLLSKRIKSQEKKDLILGIDKSVNTAKGPYMTPMLVDQIQYLFSMLSTADQKPGKDVYDRYNELKQKTDLLFNEFQSLLKR